MGFYVFREEVCLPLESHQEQDVIRVWVKVLCQKRQALSIQDLTAQVENVVVTLIGSLTYWDEPHILQAIANLHGVVSIRNLAETITDQANLGEKDN